MQGTVKCQLDCSYSSFEKLVPKNVFFGGWGKSDDGYSIQRQALFFQGELHHWADGW